MVEILCMCVCVYFFCGENHCNLFNILFKISLFCFRRFERMTPALPVAAAAAATAASFPGFLFLLAHTLSRLNCSISKLR